MLNSESREAVVAAAAAAVVVAVAAAAALPRVEVERTAAVVAPVYLVDNCTHGEGRDKGTDWIAETADVHLVVAACIVFDGTMNSNMSHLGVESQAEVEADELETPDEMDTGRVIEARQERRWVADVG